MDFSSSMYEGYLTGKLLVSSFSMTDPQFLKSVILICGHDEKGAFGLMINKPLAELTLYDFLKQFNISCDVRNRRKLIHYGGFLELTRGFVVHTPDYTVASSIAIQDALFLTSTMDMLRVIALNEGPFYYFITLGYLKWNGGQIEQEIQNNHWIVTEPNEFLLFNAPLEDRWRISLNDIGVQPAHLSIEQGNV